MPLHFAVIAPPFASHVRALHALAMTLLDRGHRVSWVQQPDVRAVLAQACSVVPQSRIGFVGVGAATHPAGSLRRVVARAARPGGPWGLARVIADVAAATDMLCRESPAALERLGVDAVIADEMEAAGGLVAQALGLPFVSVACALSVLREPRLPLPVMHWGRAVDARGLRLNQQSARVYDWLMRPHARVIAHHARRFGMPPRERLDQCLSPLACISQATAGFDFRREHAPAQLHHVGPLRSTAAHVPLTFATQPSSQPGVALSPRPGVPFVFASLGTLQGGRLGLLRRIARACAAEGVDLLLAHCDQLDAAQARLLERDGARWVVGFAPQQAALERADAVITHAGLNTVMDALAAGTPMLCLPIAFDQPGVAARVVHAGAGLRVLPALASVGSLRHGLRRLLIEPAFGARAQALGAEVRAAGGVTRTAELIERALRERTARAPASAASSPNNATCPPAKATCLRANTACLPATSPRVAAAAQET